MHRLPWRPPQTCSQVSLQSKHRENLARSLVFLVGLFMFTQKGMSVSSERCISHFLLELAVSYCIQCSFVLIHSEPLGNQWAQ